MTTISSSVQVQKDILFHELSGEAVLLNLATGEYYGLDEIGTRVWMLLLEHSKLERVLKALLQEYQVEEEQLTNDLIELVDNLVENRLVYLEGASEVHK